MKRIEKMLKPALIVFILFVFLFPVNTNAQIFGTSGDCTSDSDCTTTGYSCNTTLGKCQLKDPEKTGVADVKTVLKDTGVTGTEDIGDLVLKYVNFALPFLAIAAFLAFVYAGVLYVTAYGNEEQTQKAKKVIIYAVVGLILVILSYSIVQLLTGDLVKGIQSDATSSSNATLKNTTGTNIPSNLITQPNNSQLTNPNLQGSPDPVVPLPQGGSTPGPLPPGGY